MNIILGLVVGVGASIGVLIASIFFPNSDPVDFMTGLMFGCVLCGVVTQIAFPFELDRDDE